MARSSYVCPWCGGTNVYAEPCPYRACIRCDHRADVPKEECDCPQCEHALLTADEVIGVTGPLPKNPPLPDGAPPPATAEPCEDLPGLRGFKAAMLVFRLWYSSARAKPAGHLAAPTVQTAWKAQTKAITAAFKTMLDKVRAELRRRAGVGPTGRGPAGG